MSESVLKMASMGKKPICLRKIELSPGKSGSALQKIVAERNGNDDVGCCCTA